MSVCTQALRCGVMILAMCTMTCAQNGAAGKNIVRIRGQKQNIYLFQVTDGRKRGNVLFAPGDAGCRGFAVTIAVQLAKTGYSAYCFDTLRYLEGFTGRTPLTTTQIASDFNQIARWIGPTGHAPILFVGWSEGAGLGLATVSDVANQSIFAGLIAIGTPKDNLLAWRWRDIGAWITKSLPHEPTFESAEFIPKVSPLPLFLIASSSNEYVTPEATRTLFSAAREPKRLVMVNARDHKYSGNIEGFFTALRQGLDWIERQQH
jgi:pimeloyl-ACP methyl ester carboxylesterase